MVGFVVPAAAAVVVVVVAVAVAAVAVAAVVVAAVVVAAADLLNCRLSQTEAYQDTESRLDGESWRAKAR